MKYIFILIPILTFSNPKIENYQEEINQLKLENSKLETKIDTLNDANDKILNTIYWTIGTVFTVFIGFNLVSFIKANRDNNKTLKEIEIQSIKKVTELAHRQMESIRKSTHKEIKSLEEYFYVSLTEFHPHSLVLKDQFFIVRNILYYKIMGEVDSLSTLENYIKSLEDEQMDMSSDNKVTFIDILNESYLNGYNKIKAELLIDRINKL